MTLWLSLWASPFTGEEAEAPQASRWRGRTLRQRQRLALGSDCTVPVPSMALLCPVGGSQPLTENPLPLIKSPVAFKPLPSVTSGVFSWWWALSYSSHCSCFSLRKVEGNHCSKKEGTCVSASRHLLSLPWWLSWQRIRLQCGRPGFDPWVGKIPWRRERLPTPAFWPGEFHGLSTPWGRKESDTTFVICYMFNLNRNQAQVPEFQIQEGEGPGSRLQVAGPREDDW